MLIRLKEKLAVFGIKKAATDSYSNKKKSSISLGSYLFINRNLYVSVLRASIQKNKEIYPYTAQNFESIFPSPIYFFPRLSESTEHLTQNIILLQQRSISHAKNHVRARSNSKMNFLKSNLLCTSFLPIF